LTDLPRSAAGKTAVDVAIAAADVATAIAAPRFEACRTGSPAAKTAKGRGNFVTETDLAVEEAVIRLLREQCPDIPVLSEETSDTVEGWASGWLWVIDPIDGTGNFARGIPTFAFNLALCRDGEPVLGLTRNPVTGDEFLAVSGGGLTANGASAPVSTAQTLADSLLGFGLGYEYERAKMMLGFLAEEWPAFQTAQNIGSAALGLAYAASGRFDLYIHSFLYPWDMAAGIVQVREAGGIALARDGSPAGLYSEGLIAGAPGPVEELLELTCGRKWR
jgi:fructose-1,6-bisphosphatase/inositol monophosphatase family enzyme